MNKNHRIILSAVLSLLVIAGLLLGYQAFGNASEGNSQNSAGGQSASGQLASDPNFFAGNVTTKDIPAGTYNGIGVYDHNCLPIGNGMYSCDAGIQVNGYGTIDFDYRHDMMMKPCIGPGDSLVMKITNSGGAATVDRLSGSSSYT